VSGSTSIASDQRPGEKICSLSNLDRSLANEMPLDDTRNIVEGHVGVPDVLWEDKDDWPLFMTTGADVTEHGRRRKTQARDLLAKSFEKFTAALGAAPTISWRSADKNLSKLLHVYILSCARL
jgi:hypothetical protein